MRWVFAFLIVVIGMPVAAQEIDFDTISEYKGCLDSSELSGSDFVACQTLITEVCYSDILDAEFRKDCYDNARAAVEKFTGVSLDTGFNGRSEIMNELLRLTVAYQMKRGFLQCEFYRDLGEIGMPENEINLVSNLAALSSCNFIAASAAYFYVVVHEQIQTPDVVK